MVYKWCQLPESYLHEMAPITINQQQVDDIIADFNLPN
jgi:hypothetical protein